MNPTVKHPIIITFAQLQRRQVLDRRPVYFRSALGDYLNSAQGIKFFHVHHNTPHHSRPLSIEPDFYRNAIRNGEMTDCHTPPWTAKNPAICSQIHSTQACVESSVNTGSHSGVNNCRYLSQHWEQWREASPPILKALSVSGTANRKKQFALSHRDMLDYSE